MYSFERRWGAAALEGFCPSSSRGRQLPDQLVPEDGEVAWGSALDRTASALNSRARLGLRVAIWLVTWSPLWLLGRLSPLHRMPSSTRAVILDQLLRHRFFAVRELTMLLNEVGAQNFLEKDKDKDKDETGPVGTA